jgi:hypothetical protein
MNRRVARFPLVVLLAGLSGALGACIDTVTEPIPPERTFSADSTAATLAPAARAFDPSVWVSGR